MSKLARLPICIWHHGYLLIPLSSVHLVDVACQLRVIHHKCVIAAESVELAACLHALDVFGGSVFDDLPFLPCHYSKFSSGTRG